MIVREKESLKDCVYDTQTARQANEFKLNTEYIINHIKQTRTHNWGADIAESLKKEECITVVKPVRQRSTNNDKVEQEFEQESFNIEYKSENEIYKKRTQALKDNKGRTCALILSQCSDRLVARLKARKDFTHGR